MPCRNNETWFVALKPATAALDHAEHPPAPPAPRARRGQRKAPIPLTPLGVLASRYRRAATGFGGNQRPSADHMLWRLHSNSYLRPASLDQLRSAMAGRSYGGAS